MSTFMKLRELLGAIAGNRFQSSRLAVVGEITSIEDFTARVPFTTKADIVADHAAHPPFGSNLTFPRAAYTRFCQTSGTTAQPLAILDTPESWDWMLGNWARIYRECGIAPGDCVYFAFSFGPFLGFWTAFEGAAKYGCLCIPGGGLSSAARLRAIVQQRAAVVLCTPTYALHLAEVAAREGLALRDSAVRKIFVAGEPGGSVPAVRERISAAWNGAEVLDHYGMTEVGPVAFQRTGESDALHIIEESYFAEIIDPKTGAPVADGATGELVLTPLGREASPLLRYRTGDLVRRRAGEGFVLEGGILGRSDDMLVVRGVNIFPSAVDAILRALPEIAEYRVHVTRNGAMTELAIEIESDDDTAASRLAAKLTDSFTLRIPVTRVITGTLPRFELKARRWVR
ncbi:coenzyme F390 synthetase [Verrucomicrobiota bacterium]|nr:coenzyme F390 synthetase [Verrucomicrobiota bacterium]